MLPPPGVDPDGEWRERLLARYPAVRGFVPLLCRVITFDATAEAAPVLAALQALPDLLEGRPSVRTPAGFLDARRVDVDVVPAGWWRRLVFPLGRPEGTVDRAGYVFCVLEQFHRHLTRRNIFAAASTRWADPRARLLAGSDWEAAKGPALNALQLPNNPTTLLDEEGGELDAAWRHTAAAVTAQGDIAVDGDGRLHAAKLDAVPDPASLTELRGRLEAMLPAVDLPELILDVLGWQPGFLDAFRAASGGTTRLADLNVTVAAALCAHALNVGFAPIIDEGSAALSRARLSHVDQNYLRPDTYAAANKVLIEAQAGVELAQTWGGGLVAAAQPQQRTHGRTRRLRPRGCGPCTSRDLRQHRRARGGPQCRRGRARRDLRDRFHRLARRRSGRGGRPPFGSGQHLPRAGRRRGRRGAVQRRRRSSGIQQFGGPRLLACLLRRSYRALRRRHRSIPGATRPQGRGFKHARPLNPGVPSQLRTERITPMTTATPLYTGRTGEVSAIHRPSSMPPGYITAAGTRGHFLASPDAPSPRFSLYRWDMSATSGGPGPHFHRTYDETFIVISGVVRLYDGSQWFDAPAGDMLHVPAGGIHGFTNASGAPASMLMLLTPGADRAAYFAELARIAQEGRVLTDGEWDELMARHDNMMLGDPS